MRKKCWILFAVMGLLMTGCTQNENKKTEVPSLKSVEKAKTQQKENEDKKDDSIKDEAGQEEMDRSKATSKQTNKKAERSQSSSSTNKKPDVQATSPQETPKTDAPKQEQTKPQVKPKPEETKPAEPKPTIPTCNDTIPDGAYPIEREAEIDAQIQAEMTENALHGDGTFTQYKTEYGQTECGTKYFYIIRIYS